MHFEDSAVQEPGFDDELIVRRIRQGDERAFRALFDMYWRPLVSYANHLLGDADAAGDVVQESLAHLLVDHNRLNITSSLRAYLYRAVHNRAMDHRRRDWRRARLLQLRYTRDQPEKTTSTSEIEEVPVQLRRALDSLPERRREIFVLAHLHSMPYAQIAEVLQISPQTVANQISRALASLRTQLAPYASQLLNSRDTKHP